MGASSAVSKGNTASNVVSDASSAAESAVGTTSDTTSAIAQINQAAEAENAINLAQTMAQLKEAGPKAMKSLTQG
ncbi:hypothetical protein [Robbsia sp. KACC 23696]|uniref:hypothetical protein n=1 Tax=Robbsia sp. KACC 23696 TaxID=3149231 RepID=UPI00325BEB06